MATALSTVGITPRWRAVSTSWSDEPSLAAQGLFCGGTLGRSVYVDDPGQQPENDLPSPLPPCGGGPGWGRFQVVPGSPETRSCQPPMRFASSSLTSS